MKKLDLDDKFTRVIFRKYKIPRQGWKIHISSFLEDYDSVLKIVKRFCHDNYITFKYFSSKELYQENISNNANPAEAGKLITIYPYDVEMAYNVMLDLSKLLSNFSGPCVLSDYQFQSSKNIFFRYGINIYTSEKKLSLISNNGEIEKDTLNCYPHTPHWICVPLAWVFEDNELNELISLFHPSSIIKRKNGGNIYRGIDDNNNPVIIKEARKGIVLDDTLSSIDLRENEWNLANELDQEFVLSPIKKIETSFANYYIYKKAPGESLFDYMASNGFLVCDSNKRIRAFKTQKKILMKIFNIIKSLNAHGLTNLDVHCDNFIIDNNLNVKLIDLETVNIPSYITKTLGFWKNGMENLPSLTQDLYKFILLVLFSLGECTRFINILTQNEFTQVVLGMLKPYGKVIGIENLIEDLYGNLSTERLSYKIPRDLEKLELIPQNYTSSSNVYISSPKISTVQTLKLIYPKESFHLKHYDSLGLNGLAGTMIDNIYKNKEEEVSQELKSLESLKNSQVNAWYMSFDCKVINPYVSDGIAGMLLAISMLPLNQWPSETIQVADHLASFEFSKNYGYDNGYLGITDAILTIAYYSKNKNLFQKGISNLKKLKSMEIYRNGEVFFPFWSKGQAYLSKGKINGTQGYKLILKKWGLSNASN